MRRPPFEPTVGASDVDCAYAGGFFDGEGHVGIQRQASSYQLVVEFSQTVPGPLYWLQERWGGFIYVRPPRGRSHTTFQMTLNPRAALRFLLAVRPYLQVKAAQADVAIAFQQSRRTGGPLYGDARQQVRAEGHTAKLRLVQLRKEALA